jgi:hypothetical protein
MPSPTKLLLCCSVIAVAGCGSAVASNGAGGAATPSASGRAAAAGTAGQLVQVSGTKLTLSTTNGDVAVAYTSATVITTTSTGSPGDIVTGTCVAIVGQKDSTGAVTATTVRLSRPVNGSCALGRPAGAGGGSPRAFPSGGARPSGAPAPNPNAAVISGMVTAVTGDTVTVRTPAGATSSATVPTTLSVTESSPATPADLTVNSCLRAVGRKDAQGVVQATALTIQPPNAGGTCMFTGGGGGFGFGGGRGFGGGPPSPAA